MLAQSTRPKRKVDIYAIPTPDGVYLRGNNSRLLLKGKSLYSLVERLVPHLNGNITLEELTAGLDANRKRMITNLIEKLFAHDFLIDTSRDQHHTLHTSERETYAANIAFIGSFQESASHRFEHFREKHLLVIGSGPGLAACVQAGLQAGLKHISIMAPLEDEGSAPLDQEIADEFVRYDDAQSVQLREAPSWTDEVEVRAVIQGYDALLHVGGLPTLERARLLNRLCIEERKTLIQAMLLGKRAWIGPLVSQETGNCWECAWLRLHAKQAALSEDRARVLPPRPLSVTEAVLLAHQLLFALFQSFTEASSTETVNKISVLDLETFQTERHHFLPHPHCRACQHPTPPTAEQFLAQIQQLQRQAPLEEEHFLKQIAACIDEQCGLFTQLDSIPFVQVPLTVYKVNLAPVTSQPGSLEIVGTSIETGEARMRALLKACERYAASFLNPRRLFSLEAAQQLSAPVLSPERLLGGKSSTSEDQMWTWALDLQTQQVTLVPAAHGLPERGIASGKDWEEAVCLALLDWCNYLTVAQLKNAQQPYAQVNLAEMSLKRTGAYLYRLLQATGKALAVYDVTGALHVPTFAVCLDERVVTYSTHCDAEQALLLGLEQALQQYQSEHFQQAAYALAPVPDCPAHLRGEQLCLPRYTLPDTWSARRAYMLQQFQASGLRSFAIPLDADPALAGALPFIVRILVSREELERGE